MNRNLLLCAALLSLTACAGISSTTLPAPPKPLACAAEALHACEPPEIEPEGATLGASEEVDALNRERWHRCIHQHNAAMDCFCVLYQAGVTASKPQGCE